MLSLLNLLVIPETSAGNKIKDKDVISDGFLCLSFCVSFYRQTAYILVYVMVKGQPILNVSTQILIAMLSTSLIFLLTFNIISRDNNFIRSVLLEDLQFTVLATQVLQNTLKLRPGVFLQPPPHPKR